MGAKTGTVGDKARKIGWGYTGRLLKPQPGREPNTLGKKEPLKILRG